MYVCICALSSRLILSPLIILPIIVLSVRIGVLSADDKMMQLMLLIESATPSAQVLIVCVNQLGTPDLAANLAYIFVFEYLFSILTITFWTTIAISTFYGN
jgi:predicted permease